jgi:RimJ/RimL family protein N-acetyltransferase
MAKPEVLETRRLILEPFSEKHLSQRYVGWLNDAEVVRFSEQRLKKHTLESCRDYMTSFNGSPNYFWAIVSRNAEEGHIGNITAHVDSPNEVADIGILIGEKTLWGKGYGLEAFEAVVEFLFHQQGLRKVTAGALSINIGMTRIMQRTGMKEDGRRVRHFLCDRQEVDLIHAALFRKDWIKRKPL